MQSINSKTLNLFLTGLVATCIILTMTLPHSYAQDTKQDTQKVIAQRSEVMKLMAGKMQMLHQMLSGEIYFKKDAVEHAVKELKEKSGVHLIALFPKGSTNDKSRAKQQIWSDFTSFEAYANSLHSAVQHLEKTSRAAIKKGDIVKAQSVLPRGSYQSIDRDLMQKAMDDMKTMQQSFSMIAKTCKGCHEKFQKPKPKPAE